MEISSKRADSILLKKEDMDYFAELGTFRSAAEEILLDLDETDELYGSLDLSSLAKMGVKSEL